MLFFIKTAVFIESLCLNASNKIWYISAAKPDPFFWVQPNFGPNFKVKRVKLALKIQKGVQLGLVDIRKGFKFGLLGLSIFLFLFLFDKHLKERPVLLRVAYVLQCYRRKIYSIEVGILFLSRHHSDSLKLCNLHQSTPQDVWLMFRQGR